MYLKFFTLLGLFLVAHWADSVRRRATGPRRRMYRTRFTTRTRTVTTTRRSYENKTERPWPLNTSELLDIVRSKNFLKSERVTNIMLSVDRAKYIAHHPYLDSARYLGYGTSFNAPNVHASILENLKDFLKPGSKVLDIGSGNGYLSVCFALMVGENGTVIGMEHIDTLEYYARRNVEFDKPELLEKQLKFIVADGRRGYAEESPYDVIHIGAAVRRVPRVILQQLKRGGRMIVPIGLCGWPQNMTAVDKDMDGRVTLTMIRNFTVGYCEDLMNKTKQFFAFPSEIALRNEILARNDTVFTSSELRGIEEEHRNKSWLPTDEELGYDMGFHPKQMAHYSKEVEFAKYEDFINRI